MSFLPDPGVLLAYALASLVLILTPGPDMSLSLSRTMSGGRAEGMTAMLGASAGCVVHTLLAALGLSALIAASATAFTALKIVGAAYLLWLAVDALRNGSALNVRAEARAAAPLWRTFLVGVGINLTNPKVVLFFVTFLPQFVDAADPKAAGKLVFLGLFFVAISTPIAAALVLGAERVVATLRLHPRAMRAIDYAFAGVFGLFAVRIVLASPR